MDQIREGENLEGHQESHFPHRVLILPGRHGLLHLPGGIGARGRPAPSEVQACVPPGMPHPVGEGETELPHLQIQCFRGSGGTRPAGNPAGHFLNILLLFLHPFYLHKTESINIIPF